MSGVLRRQTLVVTPHRLQAALASVDGKSFSQWLYFGHDAERFFDVALLVGDIAAPLSAGELLNGAMREVRAELLDVDEALEYRDDVLWQSSDLAEREPSVSSFLYNATAIVAFTRLLDDVGGGLIVVVDDIALGAQLAGLARARGTDVRVELGARRRLPPAVVHSLRLARAAVARVSIVRGHLRRRRRLHGLRGARHDSGIDALLVTWAEDGTFASGRDKYLGDLAHELREQGLRVGQLGLLVPGAPQADAVLQAAARAAQTLLLEDCVGVGAIVRACVRTLRLPARTARPVVIAGVDVTATLDEALRREVASRRRCWSLQLAEVGPALARRGLVPSVVIHPFENQAWEKALRIGMHRALPGTQVVAYQHTPISSPDWFSRSPSHRDVREGQLPDRVALLGPRWLDAFVVAGYPPERLEVWPALRYEHVRHAGGGHRTRRTAQPCVLVACTMSFAEALELTVKSVIALRHTGVELVVKTHPDRRTDDDRFRLAVAAALGEESLPPQVSFAESPISELLSTCDVVLHGFTSVAWEAVAFEVPTVYVASDFRLDLDPLPDGSARQARTPDEVAAAVRELLAESPVHARARLNRCRSLLEGAFAPPGPIVITP